MAHVLTDPEEIRRELPEVYAIFFNREVSRDTETLHDKFMRLKLKCYCKDCKQTKLVL